MIQKSHQASQVLFGVLIMRQLVFQSDLQLLQHACVDLPQTWTAPIFAKNHSGFYALVLGQVLARREVVCKFIVSDKLINEQLSQLLKRTFLCRNLPSPAVIDLLRLLPVEQQLDMKLFCEQRIQTRFLHALLLALLSLLLLGLRMPAEIGFALLCREHHLHKLRVQQSAGNM